MIREVVEYNGVEYDGRHGGPFDRGTADSWYGRLISPHYYKGATEMSEKVTVADMTGSEIADYLMGYQFNEESGGKKEW